MEPSQREREGKGLRHYVTTADEVDALIITLSQLLEKKRELEELIRQPGGFKMLAVWGELARRVARIEELIHTIKTRSGEL